jgi:hypothetical protein
VATTTCCNPACGTVRPVAGPAYQRCGVCHATVYCQRSCFKTHTGVPQVQCRPAVGTRSELGSSGATRTPSCSAWSYCPSFASFCLAGAGIAAIERSRCVHSLYHR